MNNKIFQISIFNKVVPLCLCAFVALCLSSLFAQSVTEGFRARKMEGEILKWELEADSAKFGENLKTLKGVRVEFYPKDKDPFTIKADDGLVKESVPILNSTADPDENIILNKTGKKDEIHFKNNVQVIGYLKSTIKCDSLSWDSISEIMHTQDKVEVRGEKWLIKGKGIEFTPSGDVMTIKKDVTMEIN